MSYRLIKRIQHLFEDCRHVNQVGLVEQLDTDIWLFAQKNDYTIITFDADYQELSVLKGFPPKVVWLSTRNMRTEKLAQLLIDNLDKIQAFYQDSQVGCLEIARLLT